MQVNDELNLTLENVMVQPGSAFNIVLGCDLLTGDGEFLDSVKVVPGKGVKWCMAHTFTSYYTPTWRRPS